MQVVGRDGSALSGKSVFAFAARTPLPSSPSTSLNDISPVSNGFASLSGDHAITQNDTGIAMFTDLRILDTNSKAIDIGFFCEGAVALWHPEFVHNFENTEPIRDGVKLPAIHIKIDHVSPEYSCDMVINVIDREWENARLGDGITVTDGGLFEIQPKIQITRKVVKQTKKRE